MTDREKFQAWLDACPVTLRDVKEFAFGYMEVHVTLPDERDDDQPEDLREAGVIEAIDRAIAALYADIRK